MASIEISTVALPIFTTKTNEGVCLLPPNQPDVQIGAELLVLHDETASTPQQAVLAGYCDSRDPMWHELLGARQSNSSCDRLGFVVLDASLLGTLQDGSSVVIRSRSHAADHRRHDSHILALAQKALPHTVPDDGPKPTFQVSHDFGEVVGFSECVPLSPGDPRFYAKRKNRSTYVTIAPGREKEPTREVTFILGRIGIRGVVPSCYEAISMWLGGKAPAVPGSPFATADSVAFWSTNGLVDMGHGGQEYDVATITYEWPFPKVSGDPIGALGS